jgi:hypothetical protein
MGEAGATCRASLLPTPGANLGDLHRERSRKSIPVMRYVIFVTLQYDASDFFLTLRCLTRLALFLSFPRIVGRC